MKGIIPLALLLAACDVEGVAVAPPSTSPFAGKWVLTHVSGSPLPYTQPVPPLNPDSRIRPGTQIVRGALVVRLPASGLADAVLQYCQQWTDEGMVKQDLVSVTVLVYEQGDSLRVGGDEFNYPDPDVARIQGGQLALSQRLDGRDFLLTKADDDAAVGGCPK